MRTLILTALLLALTSAQAFAHGDEPHGPDAAWTFDPWIVVPLGVSAVLYAAGLTILWRRAGFGRGIRPWQAVAFGSGWLMLAGALVSPLHWLGEHVFTFHMIEHEIIMALAAPLMAIAKPFGAAVWTLPKSGRQTLRLATQNGVFAAGWRALTKPLNATILHGIAIWIWHAPVLFDAAVTNVWMHRLQHLSFFVTALLFWWALVRRSDYGAAAGHLFMTMLHTSLLGVLIALAPHLLYRVQTAQAQAWGLTPLEDQQLAGIVMWVPAGTVYAGAALAFAALWVMRSGRSSPYVPQLREHRR